MMRTAKDALQELSLDPVARRLASERETGVLMHQHMMNASLEHGLKQGRVEGRVEGLIVAAHVACQFLGIEIDAAKEQQLASLDCDQLARLVELLQSERRWPDGF